MKIVSQLPNLFDQYSVEENRITNALLQVLACSGRLAGSFLRRFVSKTITHGVHTAEIWTQRSPRDKKTDKQEEQDGQSRVPDGWYMLKGKDSGLSSVVVLESKIKETGPSGRRGLKRQLEGHLKKANRYECGEAWVLLITPDKTNPLSRWKPGNGTYTWCSWRDVHSFISDESVSCGKKSLQRKMLRGLKEFIEMKEIGGFQGIDFSDGFDKTKARAIIRKLMEEIRPEVESIFECSLNRKGNIMDPWDVLFPMNAAHFTRANHIVVSLHDTYMNIMFTVPNGNSKGWKKLKTVLESPKELREFKGILTKSRHKLPNLIMMFQQRHFVAQRFPFQEGYMEVDLDTTDFVHVPKGKTKVKKNPVLFYLLVEAVTKSPGRINREFNVLIRYYYKRWPQSRSERFKRTVIGAIKMLFPIYKFLEP